MADLGPQTIVSLQTENVKRLHAVRIEPSGNVVVISGNNGEGKTSVLDSIWYALGGKDALCDKPVREGADAAAIRVELNDLVITKIIKPDRSCTLKVTAKDGGKYAAPQGVLDALVGALSFDPMAFARMERPKQLQTLKQLVGLDFSAEDRRRQTLYDERTFCGQAGARLKAQLDAMPVYEGVTEVRVDVLMHEHAAALVTNQDNREARERVSQAKERVEECGMREERLRKQLDETIKEGEVLRKKLAEAQDRCKGLVDVDPQAIAQKMREAEDINRKVEHNKRRSEIVIEHAARQDEWKRLKASIDGIDEAKDAKLKSAAFPIPGLSVSDSAVTLNGIPFDQLSAAEQQRISLAMGFALNPKLKVLLLRDASLMDHKTLALVTEMAKERNAQVWLERVGEGQESAVVIEDGYVKGAPAPAPIASLDKVTAPPLKLVPADAVAKIVDAGAAAFADAAAEALEKHPSPPAPESRPRPTFGRPQRRGT